MTIFDISQTSFSDWSPSVFGVIFLVIGVVVLANSSKATTRMFAGVGLAFAMAVAGVGQLSLLSEFDRLQTQYSRGDYETVEGFVAAFEPASGAGNVPERFEVNGVRFELHAPLRTAAYHQTSRSGGPNLSRRCVRIAYTAQRQILWLGTLSRDQCSRTPNQEPT